MNRLFIFGILCFATLNAPAQQSCRNFNTAQLKNNGKPVPVTPDCLTRPYTVVDDSKAPCYEYKRHGLVVMECPGIEVAPEIDYNSDGVYTGYYPAHDAALRDKQQKEQDNQETNKNNK